MIGFNYPPRLDRSKKYILDCLDKNILRGSGPYCKKCEQWLEKKFSSKKVLLTGSCSHSLELAALLCDIHPGDEVILPSFTFCSTANAFALKGAKLVFVDVRPDTMNINEDLIEKAVTNKTKVIVPVHYAGVSCNMDKIMSIANKYNLFVVEDAAQGVMSSYKGRALGTIGDIGCFSFHETKNYSMGESGAILLNRQDFVERAEIIREKGTNRSQFLRGQIDKYSWVDIGSSYLPCDLSVANLYGQLELADEINSDRVKSWNLYYHLLTPLAQKGMIELQHVPDDCTNNGHLFYIKVKNIEERTDLIQFLKDKGIISLFHYIPLHTAYAGKKFGVFSGEDRFTTWDSERLLRLPMFYKLKNSDIEYIVRQIYSFFRVEL